MIKLINNINTIINGTIPGKQKYNFSLHNLNCGLKLAIYGDLKNAKNIMIVLQGLGSDGRRSRTVLTFCNSYLNEFTEKDCFITFDMPGVGDNINTEKFWGSQFSSIDVHLDDIVEYIISLNKNANLFITAFSASTLHLLAYMTDDGLTIKNKFKNNIKYFYLVSPCGDADETLDYIFSNSYFNTFLSFSHTYSKVKFVLNKKDYKKLLEVKDCLFNIKNSNYFLSEDSKYEFNFEASIDNCDVILSKNDTITNYDIVKKFLNNFNDINYIEYNFGGHAGFSNLFFTSRKHEDYIINSIKKQC